MKLASAPFLITSTEFKIAASTPFKVLSIIYPGAFTHLFTSTDKTLKLFSCAPSNTPKSPPAVAVKIISDPALYIARACSLALTGSPNGLSPPTHLVSTSTFGLTALAPSA